jgi:HEAT repeat protein
LVEAMVMAAVSGWGGRAFGRGPAAAGPVAVVPPPAAGPGDLPGVIGKGPAGDSGQGPGASAAGSGLKPGDTAKSGRPTETAGLIPEPVAISDEKIYDRLIKSCAWVVTSDGTAEGVRHGSGAVIDLDERLVVTNEHVANATCVRISVLFPAYRDGKLIAENKYYRDELDKGNAIPAKLVRVDRGRDLALIQLDRLPGDAVPVRVGTRPPSPGQKVQTVGANPKNNPWQWVRSEGPVRQVSVSRWHYEDGFPREAEVIVSQVPINGGDSGGPVVDYRGVLVGVNNGWAPGFQNATHISVTEVRDFIAAYFLGARKEWKEPPEPSAEALAGVSVAKLIKALEGSNVKDRGRAARLLANLGPAAKEAVPALLNALRATNEEDENRPILAMALSEIGPPDKAAVADLTAALRDKNCKEARRYAADALGKLGEGAKGAAAALVPALKDADPTVRRNAASSLGRLGPAARDEAFDSLFALLRDPEPEVRKTAMGALMKMGKPPTDVASLRAQAADFSAPEEARHYAVLALQKFPDEAVPALIDILTTERDPKLASDAAFVLGHIKAQGRLVGAALAKALEPGKDKSVRVSAAHAIREIGLDQHTLPAFMKALDSPEEEIRKAALRGMTNISIFAGNLPSLTLTKDAVAVLAPGLGSDQAYARWFAAFGLSSLKEEAAPAVPQLRAALAKEQNRDPMFSPVIHLEILAALAEIGPDALSVLDRDADKFLDELKEIANDPDDRAYKLRTAAALALAKIAPDKPQARATLAVLVKALRLPNFNKPDHNLVDDELHKRAAKALIKAGKFAARPLAQTCFAQFSWRRDDPQQTQLEKQYACRKAFEVLERIGPEAACPEVQQLLRAARDNRDEVASVKEAAGSAYFAIYKSK